MGTVHRLTPVSEVTRRNYLLTRKELLSSISTQNIMPTHLLPELSEYFLLYWEGKYFKSKVKEGALESESGKFLVIYDGITPELAYNAVQLSLSFRRPVAEYNLPGYVIVSLVGNYRRTK